MNTSSTSDLETSQEVFVLSTDGRSSGTPNTGIIYLNFGALRYTSPFCLKLTSFNTIFSAPNVSDLRGNTMQYDDGTNTYTVVLPTGSYTIGGSSDIGTRLATLMSGRGITFTSTYDNATNLYTIKGTAPFRFVFTNPNKDIYAAAQLGFDKNIVQTLSSSQTATTLPHFYENNFLISITSNNAVTDLVSIPRSSNLLKTSFIIPRTADFGGQIYLSLNQLTPQRISFSTSPSSIAWRLSRPDGRDLEQQLDWTAIFSIEVYKSQRKY